ncbi:MAG: 50S ribosomal protein L13 [bacterium]|nr:50S ribosomal protein L13 [bacterium]
MAMPNQIQRQLHQIDATDKILGRLASEIADLLRGKKKPEFVPNLDVGDTVVVENARKIRLTGNKLSKKIYYRHTGYPGGIRQKTANEIMNSDPTELIRHAVHGMLPKNKLRRLWMNRLKIHADSASKEQ